MAPYTDVTYLRQNLLCLTNVYLADEDHCSTPKGSFNNHVGKKRGKGIAKCPRNLISLYFKQNCPREGGGVENDQSLVHVVFLNDP